MEPTLTHHKSFTVIGFSEEFGFNEGYEKCPKFWEKAYSARFSRLFQTMKAETPEEQAVLENHIGEYAVCNAIEGKEAFKYMICGEYKGGDVPKGMELSTVPESDWLEFRSRGPLPQALQELNTFIHQVWMKEHSNEYQSRGIDIEWYSAGNPSAPDYECGIFIPVVKTSQKNSLCGEECVSCTWKDKCNGCTATNGHPFGGECILAQCRINKGLETCNACPAPCALKAKIIEEFNALCIPNMPKVTELHALPGSFINMEYTLANGCKFKFWDDNRIYLGNQLEKTDGSERCYGLTADETHLLVCEYGCNGADPEIIVYKRR